MCASSALKSCDFRAGVAVVLLVRFFGAEKN